MVVQTLVLRRTIDVGPRRFSCLVVMVPIHYICKFKKKIQYQAQRVLLLSLWAPCFKLIYLQVKKNTISSIAHFTFIPMGPLFQTNISANKKNTISSIACFFLSPWAPCFKLIYLQIKKIQYQAQHVFFLSLWAPCSKLIYLQVKKNTISSIAHFTFIPMGPLLPTRG